MASGKATEERDGAGQRTAAAAKSSLPWDSTAAAGMHTKALVAVQAWQHQDERDFRRGVGTCCRREHDAQKRNPQPYAELRPAAPAPLPSGAEDSTKTVRNEKHC